MRPGKTGRGKPRLQTATVGGDSSFSRLIPIDFSRIVIPSSGGGIDASVLANGDVPPHTHHSELCAVLYDFIKRLHRLIARAAVVVQHDDRVGMTQQRCYKCTLQTATAVDKNEVELRFQGQRQCRIIEPLITIVLGRSSEICADRMKSAPLRKLRDQLGQIIRVIVNRVKPVDSKRLAPLNDCESAVAGSPFKEGARHRLDMLI